MPRIGRLLTILGGLFLLAIPKVQAQATTYGTGVQTTSLNNINVGGPNNWKVAYRFKSAYTSTITGGLYYRIFSTTKPGYSGGTLGTIVATIAQDSAGAPGATLTTCSGANTGNFPVLTCSAAVTAGQTYYLVFTNTDSSPTVNFASVDGLYDQGGVPDPNFPFAALISNGSTWTVYPTVQPILQLNYANGHAQGNGYMEVWINTSSVTLSATTWARETFTPTLTHTSTGVQIGSGAIAGTTVTLALGDGTLIETGTLPAPASTGWATFNFSQNRVLTAGTTYQLILKGTGTAYPIRKGTNQGFTSETYFPDGHAQSSTNSGGTWIDFNDENGNPSTLGDLEFSFLAPVSPNIYFTQNPVGLNNGTNCANAYSAGRFNTLDTNWIAGNALHICGTITSTLKVQAAGTAGNPITIIFEPGTVLSQAICPTTGCFNDQGFNWITLDGGTNGIVQNTANGTGLANSAASVGVYFKTASNIEIKNLTVRNIYQRTGSGTDGDNNFGILVDSSSYANVLIHNNTVSAATTNIGVQFDCACTISNISIYQNTLSNQRWGIEVGSGTNGASATSISIHDNDISNWTPWGNNSVFHTDGMILFATCGTPSTCTLDGGQIYNNYIHGDLGTGSPTAFIFLSSRSHAFSIFNNLLVVTSGVIDGIIWIRTDALGGHQIYNNTINGWTTASSLGIELDGNGGSPATSTIKNNIITNVQFAIQTASANFSTVLAASNNNDWNAGSSQPFVEGNGSTFLNFAGFQALGYDVNGSTAAPNLNGTWRPNAGSPAIGLGVNLAAISTGNMAPLLNDKAGATRPAIGAWDAGAFTFTAQVTPPLPPTSLHVVIY